LEENTIAFLFVRNLLLELFSPQWRFVTPVTLVDVSSPWVGSLDEPGSVRELISSDNGIGVALHKTVGVLLTLSRDREHVSRIVGRES
jgi:hypothetical protein